MIDPTGLSSTVQTLVVTGIQTGWAALSSPASIAAFKYGSALLVAGLTAHWLTRSYPLLIYNIESGVAEAGKVAATLINDAEEYANAIEQAIIEIAEATAAAIETLRKLPFFPIVKSLGPAIYELDVQALKENKRWYKLTYNGAGNPRTALNRAEVALASGLSLPRPEGMQLDEFPYASTQEEGLGAKWDLVPAKENQTQGFYLWAFYLTQFNFLPGTFIVVPVPL